MDPYIEPLVFSDVALQKLGKKKLGLVLGLAAVARMLPPEQAGSEEIAWGATCTGDGARLDLRGQGSEPAEQPGDRRGADLEVSTGVSHSSSDARPEPFLAAKAMASEVTSVAAADPMDCQVVRADAELATAGSLSADLAGGATTEVRADMGADVTLNDLDGEVAADVAAADAAAAGDMSAADVVAADGGGLPQGADSEEPGSLEQAAAPPLETPAPRLAPTRKRRRRREVSLEDDAGLWDPGEVGARTLRQIARLASYAELAEDQGNGGLGDDMPGVGRGKKKRQKLTPEVDDREARIAAAVGFPPNSLLEEEIEAGVVSTFGGVEQQNYIQVRNHILATWRHRVDDWLELDEVMEGILSQHRALASSAYHFLVAQGYINFGVAPAMRKALPKEPHKASVIVVGAGLAGLAAARQLLAFGHKVAIVEGRQRPGGRVYTKKMERDSHVAAADLGGSVITGADGNPLAVLARQLGFALHKIRDTCPLYCPDGAPVDLEVDDRVEYQFNWMLDEASRWREEMDAVADHITLGTTLDTIAERAGLGTTPEERQLLNWHMANLEYANAALLSDTSFAKWDQDDIYEFGGDHCFLAGGNGRLVGALADGLPLFLGLTVKEIKYGRQGVKVTAVKPGWGGEGGQEQVFEADMVLCTVPLGVLKKDTIHFDPPLPQRKQEAIKRLGFGLLNKVAMLFPHAFWGDHLDTFGRVVENPAQRGEFFLFYSYAAVAGGALLLGLVAGEAAHRFEEMRPEETVARVMAVLRGIFEPQGVSVPHPKITQCTRWKADPLAGGSYSYIQVGASGEDYDILAANVSARLFFAGEATSRRYPATMHGAFLSGLREAGKIAQVAAERAEPASKKKVQQKMSLQQCGAALEEIFQEPDVEFGAFAVVYDPRSRDPEAQCLVRVTVRGEPEGRGERRQEGGKQAPGTPANGKALDQQHPKAEQNGVEKKSEWGTRKGYFTNLIHAQSRGIGSHWPGGFAQGTPVSVQRPFLSSPFQTHTPQPGQRAPAIGNSGGLLSSVRQGSTLASNGLPPTGVSPAPQPLAPGQSPGHPQQQQQLQPQPGPESRSQGGTAPTSGVRMREPAQGEVSRKETAPKPRTEGHAKKQGHWKRRPVEEPAMGAKQPAYLKQTLQLYAVVSRRGAEQLREVQGGDPVRVFFLSEHLGVKLVGRRGLGPMGDELVGAVKWARLARQKEAAAAALGKLERGNGSGPSSGAKLGGLGRAASDAGKGRHVTANGRLNTGAAGLGKLATKETKGESDRSGRGGGVQGSPAKAVLNGGAKGISFARDGETGRLMEATVGSLHRTM